MLVLRCSLAVVVWYPCLQAEAQLVCSCGMWGLGVNERLEQGVDVSWALFRNEIAFMVEGLGIVFFVRQE